MIRILDGGLATELERRGADLRDPLWSAKLLIDDPALIRQVHEDYYLAGADVATSASYQASFLGFTRRGLTPRRAAELMKLSVQIAQDARDRVAPGRLVAASIGCYGASLGDGSEYRGHYDLEADDLIDWHRPRLETLLDARPDLLAFETIPCLAEAEAIARLLEDLPGVEAWVSFCCRDEQSLASGESFAEAVRIVTDAPGIAAVGVNCVAPRLVEPLLRLARSATEKPLVAYPNSGERWDADSRSWRDSPATFDPSIAGPAWRDAGASWVGGCCRTTPDTIRGLRAALGLP